MNRHRLLNTRQILVSRKEPNGLGTFHLKVLRLGNIKEIIAFGDLKCMLPAILVYECNMQSTFHLISQGSNVSKSKSHSSPGFGGVR